MESQITGVSIVCTSVWPGTDHRKHQSSASLAFARGFHWWPINSPHKGPVTRKMLPFDDVIILPQVRPYCGCRWPGGCISSTSSLVYYNIIRGQCVTKVCNIENRKWIIVADHKELGKHISMKYDPTKNCGSVRNIFIAKKTPFWRQMIWCHMTWCYQYLTNTVTRLIINIMFF